MLISDGCVVQIRYRLECEGEPQLTEPDCVTTSYIHGRQPTPLIGMTRHLEGLMPGSHLRFTLLPEEAFGPYQNRLQFEMSRTALPPDVELIPGLPLHTQSEPGVFQLRVLEVRPDVVLLDGNHPFAGKSIDVELDVVSVRPAVEAELARGWVLGA